MRPCSFSRGPMRLYSFSESSVSFFFFFFVLGESKQLIFVLQESGVGGVVREFYEIFSLYES